MRKRGSGARAVPESWQEACVKACVGCDWLARSASAAEVEKLQETAILLSSGG